MKDLEPTGELLEKRTLARLLNVKSQILYQTLYDYRDINPLDSFDNKVYIISTLCATDLFNIYKNETLKGRKEIDKEINKILIGDKTVDGVMGKYEVTSESGAKIVKKQIKQFSK